MRVSHLLLCPGCDLPQASRQGVSEYGINRTLNTAPALESSKRPRVNIGSAGNAGRRGSWDFRAQTGHFQAESRQSILSTGLRVPDSSEAVGHWAGKGWRNWWFERDCKSAGKGDWESQGKAGGCKIADQTSRSWTRGNGSHARKENWRDVRIDVKVGKVILGGER